MAEQEVHTLRVARDSIDIFGDSGMLYQVLQKAKHKEALDGSNAGAALGRRDHLVDKVETRKIRDLNSTHAICLDAKKASSLGLGHREMRIHEVLDPLTRFSWQDVLDADADDFWETGESFIEVVYGDPDEPDLVTGLHHLRSSATYLNIERQDDTEAFHYVVHGEGGLASTGERAMARWGDRERLQMEYGSSQLSTSGEVVNSEVIHIRQATNRDPYYGLPDYLASVPSIELVQCMTQHEFDFYFNRGVPEFLFLLIGKNIGKCWDQIEKMMKAGQGLGNSHKSGAIHIPGDPENIQVQIEKLAMEKGAESGFEGKSNTLDSRICTAHGMPPALANIFVPGKMSAANEGPNSLLTFQVRKLGQAQKNFSGMFAQTLGQSRFAQPGGAPVKLSGDLFRAKGVGTEDENGMPIFVQPGNGFNTIMDGMTLGARDTMSRMQDQAGDNGARNPEDGLLDGARDRQDGDPNARRD